MAKGNEIVLAACPKGVFLEGLISGALKPGTLVQIQAGTAFVGGRPTWEAYETVSGADGDPRMPAILLPDWLQGQLSTTAYVSGVRCFVYVPIKGEEMNVLVAAQVGTGSANAYTIGERLQPQHATGKFISQGTSANGSPFMVMEHIDLPADTDGLVWVIAT